MNLPLSVTQEELSEVLLNVAPVRPVYIWGAPGIGKSALVEQFAENVGLPCVSLLGSQLAPEDIIGIPQVKGETSEFLPPKMIARKEPYVLFLDELNACSQEVQKAFYSLIYEKRVGEYHLPEGSIIIGAGNRMQDGAIVKTMSSALLNRMFHVQMKVDATQWLTWAYQNDIHSWVTDYITQRPDHLFSEPPKTEEPYSTPRSWHMLSDILKEYGAGKKKVEETVVRMLAYGCVSASHVRVVFCDADAYDAGYLSPEDVAGRVEVKGRGGTRLQPGIDLLESAKDFPKDGPILIITDGECEENLAIHRKHAYLLPQGKSLPFRAKGKVFYFS